MRRHEGTAEGGSWPALGVGRRQSKDAAGDPQAAEALLLPFEDWPAGHTNNNDVNNDDNNNN